MAAYTDAVRYRAGWLATPEAFEPTPGLIERSLAIVGGRGPGRVPLARRGLSWRRVALAGAALGLGLTVLIVVRSDLRTRAESPRLPSPIRLALEDLSGRGLVLPGGEAGAASAGPVLRSGVDQTGRELDAAVREAIARYEAGRRHGAHVYPVAAGLHCAGQTEAARNFVDEGLRSDSNDVRLLVLRADIAYRSSDLTLAERTLRKALAVQRESPAAALDLAIVLAELHRRDEAARWFEESAKHGPAPIAARAQRELEALEAP